MSLVTPVNEERNLLAEPGLDLAERDRRIFGYVVQEPGRDGRAVHAQLRQLQRNGKGVLDKRLTRPPKLAVVGGLGHVVGPAHDRGVVFRKIAAQLGEQVFQPQRTLGSLSLGSPVQRVLDLDRFLNVDCQPTASAPTLASRTFR